MSFDTSMHTAEEMQCNTYNTKYHTNNESSLRVNASTVPPQPRARK